MNNPHSLYDLGVEYNAIIQEIEDADGVLSPDLEERHDAIVAKLAGSAANVKSALAMIKRGEDELDEWLDKLARRKASLAKEAERWKNAAMANMIGMRINKLEGVLNGLPVKLAVCESESVAIDIEAEKLPDELCTIKTVKTPDKKAIKAAILAGDDTAVRVAHIERKTYLRVS
jgi:hypothetical protein